jgi:CHAT domain-containing protein
MEGYLIMAKISIATGEPDRSREYVNKSITAARLEGYKLFRQYQVLADIEINLGYPEQAVIARQDALGEARASKIIPQIIWACLRLGDAYNELGNTDKAREYYREARDLEKSIHQNSSLTPSIQMRLGELQNAYDLFNVSGATLGAHIATLNLIEDGLSDNQTDSAIALLDQSITYFNNQGITEGEGKALIMQSIIYKNKGEYERSLAILEKAEHLDLRPEVRWKLKYNNALVYQKLNNIKAQEAALQEAIAIIEAQRSNITSNEFKWHYLDQKTDVFDSYISLILAQENPSKSDIVRSFEINERARSRTFLDMLLDQNLVSSDPQINREISLIKENQQLLRIVEEKSLKGVEVASIKKRIQANEEELRQLESKLDKSTQKFTRLRTVEPVKLAELQQYLDNKTAVLEFWAGKDQLVVWKITNTDISHKIIDTNNTRLHRSVAKLRNLVKFGVEDRILAGFKELNDILEPGFQDVFKDYDNVIVIPHGPLHFIPFDALTDGEKFIVERAVLHYSPSASVYYYATKDIVAPEKKNLLGMALGEHEIDEHPGLPGTSMELNQVAQFYPDNNLVFEDEITEEYFKKHAEEYELIHLASHGVFNRNKPGRSYILMTPSGEDDGKLMVDEIYDMELNAHLVALSACETGLGDLSEGDELVGLSRAFLYAGTSAIIVSLWKVDDISTSILMTRMHQLIEAGMSPDNALAEAKRSLIVKENIRQSSQLRGAERVIWHPQINEVVNADDNKHTSPYYWAPFIIIGGRMNN